MTQTSCTFDRGLLSYIQLYLYGAIAIGMNLFGLEADKMKILIKEVFFLLKKIRWISYGLIILVLAFYGWHFLIQHKQAQAASKYKKDLYITNISPPQKAPGFKLTSQRGNKVSLSQFQGKKVLLQFMDTKCTDICPLISQEIIGANHLLGSHSKNVVYIGVNVNEYHNKVSDLKSFSNQHGLSKLSNWYFLTGSPEQLKQVWKKYGIDVTPNKTGDVQHTSAVFFIDPSGKETFLGHPQNEKTSVQEWAHGMSFFIQRMPNHS